MTATTPDFTCRRAPSEPPPDPFGQPVTSDRRAPGADRHDLLHAYAAEQAALLAPGERRAALARLRAHYLSACTGRELGRWL